jgi:hypothetical protein
MRLIVQSLATGKFLCPSSSDGSPEWVVSLRESGGGVVTDFDLFGQWVMDHCDHDDLPQVIDLDRLGTVNDYTPN